jgi:hypothetical protein
MKRTEAPFAVCVKNEGYAAALELRKFYRIVADEAGARLHHIRVMTNPEKTIFIPQNTSSRCSCMDDTLVNH